MSSPAFSASRARAVHVDLVRAARGAEHRQVERRVAGLQRVERPHHRLEAHVTRAAALLELELAPDPAALVRWMDAGELRVQDQAVVAGGRGRRRRSRRAPWSGVEGAKDETADFLRAGHVRDRQHVAVLGDAPGSPLQLLAGAQLVARRGCRESSPSRVLHFIVVFGTSVSKWLALLALVALLWVARGVLPPFIVAGILAYILSPLVDELADRPGCGGDTSHSGCSALVLIAVAALSCSSARA